MPSNVNVNVFDALIHVAYYVTSELIDNVIPAAVQLVALALVVHPLNAQPEWIVVPIEIV